MKVPLSWLREYVECGLSPKDLASRLTFAGLEVEGVHAVERTFDGVVAAQVLAIDPHPNADKLRVCRVTDGQAERTVVCGAWNFAVGDRVPFAGVGVTLANGMRIKEAKLRGVLSAGMLCAEDELGISDDHSGLLRLPADTVPGTALSALFGPPDWVIEIEVTPNRPDCLSIMGIAREVAALCGVPMRRPAIEFAELGPAVTSCTRVEVDDAEGCPRYTGRVFAGVTIAESPLWMKERLRLSGIRPINNVVDITNYVMLECGQPMHAFDQSLLEEGRIVVRRARPGEKLATLDGTDRPIDPDMLVIADARRPVALAGVMGGAGSEIRPDTQKVLLESACFSPTLIRRTSKRVGLSTESSYRYERGVDPELADWASRRAAGYLVALAGATAARGVVDVYGRQPSRKTVRCTFDGIRTLIGAPVADDEMVRIFEALELKVVERDASGCAVQAPTFRVDLEREADLVEEVARIHGLDRIPAPTPRAQLVEGASNAAAEARMACRSALVGLGLSEIMNYSFLSQAELDRFDATDRPRRVVIPNPISADHSVLRPSLISQVTDALGRNRSRQAEAAGLFEIGRVFFKRADGTLGEEERVAIGLMGPLGRDRLDRRRPVEAQEIFQWLKGAVEGLCAAMRVPRSSVDLAPADAPCFEPGHSVRVRIAGRDAGMMGIVASGIRREWRLADPVAVAELRLDTVSERAFDVPASRPLSVFPSVGRDIAILVGEEVTSDAVMKVILQAAPRELVRADLFDVYRSKGDAGRKSMAYALVFQAADRTLTDEEANGFRERVRDALARELRAEIRDR